MDREKQKIFEEGREGTLRYKICFWVSLWDSVTAKFRDTVLHDQHLVGSCNEISNFFGAFWFCFG